MLRGARQVGKSYTVECFGQVHFKNLVIINFEQRPECKKYFESLDPKVIINLIELSLNANIIPGETGKNLKNNRKPHETRTYIRNLANPHTIDRR